MAKPKRNKKKPLTLVALGGNVLIKLGQRGVIGEKETNALEIVQHLVRMVKSGFNLVITHGNGPQVGNMLIRTEAARKDVPPMPLDICVAWTQGSMGYLLQNALLNELWKQEMHDKRVVTAITEVLVDKKDPAFKLPTKPIGPFVTKDRAEELMKSGVKMVEDAGRGWRRVVPSPKPKHVIQRRMIKSLADSGKIVIAAGGGGIPVYRKPNGEWEGIDAVIDKDLASAWLAREIKADLFVILTQVAQVYLNYDKPDASGIDAMTIHEAKKYIKQDHFAEGSMKPKIEAAIDFLSHGGKRVIITRAGILEAALEGRAGTHIVRRKEDKKWPTGNIKISSRLKHSKKKKST
ncbi:MAG: carbamate kinase [Planctomycetota bacterium]|jgi:carbamate kinase